MLKRTAIALSLLCLAVSACKPEEIRSVSALRPDKTNPERFVCEAAGTRPVIPGEHQIDWTKVATVDQAKAEFLEFVSVLRDREAGVATYILDLEQKHSTCAINMDWQRDFYAGLDQPPEQP